MTTLQLRLGLRASAPGPGQPVRVRMVGGQTLEGRLARADDRTLRVQDAERHALVVVYRQAATAIEFV